MRRLLFVTLALLGVSACAHAGSPEPVFPSLERFQNHATQTVDIDVGPFKLAIAGWFMSGGDPDTEAVRDVIKACKSVRVRSYQFGPDFEYPEADIDALRAQLSSGGWSPLAKVRNRKSNGDVDVYVALEHETITGLVVIASERRELTIVNVVGSIDPSLVDRLRTQFGSHRHGRSTADDVPPDA